MLDPEIALFDAELERELNGPSLMPSIAHQFQENNSHFDMSTYNPDVSVLMDNVDDLEERLNRLLNAESTSSNDVFAQILIL